jgi:hypothetical protein
LKETAMHPLDQLNLERERTRFMFYGYRTTSGEMGRGYSKLAHSLSVALAHLDSDPGVADEGGYVISDAFVEVGDNPNDFAIHVELVSINEMLELLSEDTTIDFNF